MAKAALLESDSARNLDPFLELLSEGPSERLRATRRGRLGLTADGCFAQGTENGRHFGRRHLVGGHFVGAAMTYVGIGDAGVGCWTTYPLNWAKAKLGP